MGYDCHLTAEPWADYELLDSGDTMKLERFGSVIVARPETQALWRKQKPEIWAQAHAEFAFKDNKGLPTGRQGRWDNKQHVPESWPLSWRDAKFAARLTGFKHTGIFPEQAPNWEWLSEKVSKLKNPKVLNLFGYTGIASVVAAQAGAHVTHVDASKQSLDWAHDNTRLSGVGEGSIRWILDDALAFVKREVRRGAKYDGIILDPPAFGRGAKGEVWKIEEALPALLTALKELLSDAPGSFLLLNGYAAGYAPLSFAQAVAGVFSNAAIEAGELRIKESTSDRVIPAGIYVRFARPALTSVGS